MVKPVYHPGKQRAKIECCDLLNAFKVMAELGHADGYIESLANVKTQLVASPELINHTKDYIVEHKLYEKNDLLRNTVISVDTNC